MILMPAPMSSSAVIWIKPAFFLKTLRCHYPPCTQPPMPPPLRPPEAASEKV
jgi:hypothetical protein